MSALASDSNFIAFNISSKDKFQQNQNLLSLSEVSPIGKIWDKHRANTDKVLQYYAKADEHYFQQYAWRMKMCSELLEFQLVPNESEGILKLKLSDIRFCRVRHCPICQWRRRRIREASRREAACRQTSLMWKARAYKILPQVVTDYPKHRWLFVTLTVKNCPIKELRENLDSINKAFKRFTELKVRA
ncbi:protein rep [Nostoc sp.]|uniref:protein rep n=1 Tax=Nostoc sp. TaxID=1180 RepID=UPI002FF87914